MLQSVVHFNAWRPPISGVVRYTLKGVLYGHAALAHDALPEATALFTDDDVAEMIERTGSPPCHPEYVARTRSLIATERQRLMRSAAADPHYLKWLKRRLGSIYNCAYDPRATRSPFREPGQRRYRAHVSRIAKSAFVRAAVAMAGYDAA
jgi:hypothetical protein